MNAPLRVIAYDIVNDRRRLKVARILEGHGERVQDSVFECWLDDARTRRVLRRIAALIDPAEDRVRCYTLCGRDQRDIICCGKATPTRDTHMTIV